MSDLLQELKSAALDARLSFKLKEVQELLAKTKKIQQKVQDLKKQFDNTNELPLFTPSRVEGRMAEDRPGEALPLELALACAPDTDHTCFRVPRIVAE